MSLLHVSTKRPQNNLLRLYVQMSRAQILASRASWWFPIKFWIPTRPRRPRLSDPCLGRPPRPTCNQPANSSSAPSWCTANGSTCPMGWRLPGPPPLQVGWAHSCHAHDSHHVVVAKFKGMKTAFYPVLSRWHSPKCFYFYFRVFWQFEVLLFLCFLSLSQVRQIKKKYLENLFAISSVETKKHAWHLLTAFSFCQVTWVPPPSTPCAWLPTWLSLPALTLACGSGAAPWRGTKGTARMTVTTARTAGSPGPWWMRRTTTTVPCVCLDGLSPCRAPTSAGWPWPLKSHDKHR